jgi:hypothetical protein
MNRPPIPAANALLLSFILFVYLAAAGQIRPGISPTPDSAKYTVSGIVVDAVTEKPITHALVNLYGNGQHMVFSDGEGRFQFSDLTHQQVRLNAVKPGYLQQGQVESWDSGRGMVTVGPDMPPLIIGLVPESEIHGSVTDSNGDALDGVRVQLFRFAFENGVRKRQNAGQVQTDEDGGYQFSALVPGDYMLSAGPAWKDLADPFKAGTTPTFVYAETFFSGVLDVSAATVLHLTPATHEKLDVSMNTAKSFVVSGTVTGGVAGQENLQFLNSAGEEMAVVQRKVGRNSFSARVLPGACLVKAFSHDTQGKRLYAQAEVNVSNDVSGLHLDLARIQVPIVFERISVATSPTSSDPRGIAPPQLRLISLDPLHPDAWSENIDAQDHWESAINNIEYGRYRVEVNDGQWYPSSITSGGNDLRSEPLVVVPGDIQPIEITLRNDVASLRVRVDSSEKENNSFIRVVVLPEQSPGRPIVQSLGSLTQQAYFSLPPGRYSILAFQDPPELDFQNVDLMRGFMTKATSVDLQPQKQSEISVSLIRRSK